MLDDDDTISYTVTVQQKKLGTDVHIEFSRAFNSRNIDTYTLHSLREGDQVRDGSDLFGLVTALFKRSNEENRGIIRIKVRQFSMSVLLSGPVNSAHLKQTVQVFLRAHPEYRFKPIG